MKFNIEMGMDDLSKLVSFLDYTVFNNTININNTGNPTIRKHFEKQNEIIKNLKQQIEEGLNNENRT